MSSRVDTYSVECNCGTCQMLRDSVAPSCRGCRYRHDEVVTLTAENEELRDYYTNIMATSCHGDEKHCACVPALRKKVEEANNLPCPVCIARRGIDRCRPDEEFHVTHYDAEEMNMDPLPDKPCECGGE